MRFLAKAADVVAVVEADVAAVAVVDLVAAAEPVVAVVESVVAVAPVVAARRAVRQVAHPCRVARAGLQIPAQRGRDHPTVDRRPAPARLLGQIRVEHRGQNRQLHPVARQVVGPGPEIVLVSARAATWQVRVIDLELAIDLIVPVEPTEAVDLTAQHGLTGLTDRDGVTMCGAVKESHARTGPTGRMELMDLIVPIGSMAAVAGVTVNWGTTGTPATGAMIIGITIIGTVTGIMDIGTADTGDIGTVDTIGTTHTGIPGARGRLPGGFGADTTTTRATEATITPIMSNQR
jgi:hypothetical protein